MIPFIVCMGIRFGMDVNPFFYKKAYGTLVESEDYFIKLGDYAIVWNEMK
jgi:hypothetical protein